MREMKLDTVIHILCSHFAMNKSWSNFLFRMLIAENTRPDTLLMHRSREGSCVKVLAASCDASRLRCYSQRSTLHMQKVSVLYCLYCECSFRTKLELRPRSNFIGVEIQVQPILGSSTSLI